MKFKLVVIDLELSARAKRIAAAVVTSLFAVGGGAVAYADVTHAWKEGEVLSATDLNGNFASLDGRVAAMEGKPAPLPVPSGTIVAFGSATAPTGWRLCDGSTLDGTSAQYAALYAAIGTGYGNGNTMMGSFNLPDLRGRVAVGVGTGPGLSARAVGQALGEEAHTLTVAEMPSHTHTIFVYGSGAGANQGAWNFNWSSAGVYGAQSALPPLLGGGFQNFMQELPAGGGVSHNVMQPSLVVNYIIKI